MSHMIPKLRLIFLILAFLLFLLTSFGVSHPRCQLGWLGMAFLTLAIWFPYESF
jgi:hypothetical protein